MIISKSSKAFVVRAACAGAAFFALTTGARTAEFDPQSATLEEFYEYTLATKKQIIELSSQKNALLTTPIWEKYNKNRCEFFGQEVGSDKFVLNRIEKANGYNVWLERQFGNERARVYIEFSSEARGQAEAIKLLSQLKVGDKLPFTGKFNTRGWCKDIQFVDHFFLNNKIEKATIDLSAVGGPKKQALLDVLDASQQATDDRKAICDSEEARQIADKTAKAEFGAIIERLSWYKNRRKFEYSDSSSSGNGTITLTRDEVQRFVDSPEKVATYGSSCRFITDFIRGGYKMQIITNLSLQSDNKTFRATVGKYPAYRRL